MKRNHKFSREKEWLALERELKQLWKDQRDAGTLIDIEPYQRGWYRFFVLKDNHKNQKYSRDAQTLLDLVLNVRRYSNRKDFKVWSPKEHDWVSSRQLLHRLTHQEYNKLDERYQKYFQMTQEYSRYSRRLETYFEFKHPQWFELKIEPNMISKEWIPDAALESRIAELESYMRRNNVWDRLNRLHGCSTNRRDRDWGYKTKSELQLKNDRIELENNDED